MFTWIEIGLVYLLAMGLFCWLGGISAAGDALSRWGCATAELCRTTARPRS